MDSLIEKHNPQARSGHVACDIGECMLVWGGASEVEMHNADDNNQNINRMTIFAYSSVVWLYYPDIDKWFKKKCTGHFPPHSSGSSIVCHPSRNHVYLIFGSSLHDHLNSMHRLNISSFEFSRIVYAEATNPAKLPSPRNKQSAWMFRNKIYSFGGYGPPIEKYLFEKAKFTTDYSYSVLNGWNNQLLEYELTTSTWKEIDCKGTVPSPRAAHSTAQVGEKVMLFGGRHQDARLNDLHQLDMNTFVWNRIETSGLLPLGRSWHTLNYLSNDHTLLLVGGFSTNKQVLGDAWTYDLKSSTWHNASSLPSEHTKRMWHTSVVVEGQVILFGGCERNVFSHDPGYIAKLAKLQTSPQSLYRLSLRVLLRMPSMMEHHSLPSCITQHIRKFATLLYASGECIDHTT